jgi:urease accessory protein
MKVTPLAIIQIISTTMGIAIDLEPMSPCSRHDGCVAVTTVRPPASDAADADAALIPLMLWLSPAFPVGSFAYSQGLEWAVESGDIHDARSLGEWLVDLLSFGAPRADAILFGTCFRAAVAEDWEALAKANELAIALANSAERRLETTAQGRAFVLAARAAWDCEALRRLSLAERVAYPAAVASAAAGHGAPLEAGLQAFILAQIAAAVSAVVRLGPIGQTDGQKIQATLIPRIRALAREASGSNLTDLGSCAFRSDTAAMRHETQYSRLFRS